MRRNLFNYLEKLNEQDLARLDQYLKSPFFSVTNKKRVITLYKYLKRYHPNYHDNPKTDNEVIAQKLEFQNVGNLRTNLLDAVSHYLQLKGLERNQTIQTFLLADTLDHLKISEFERFTKKAIQKIDEKSAKDATAYFLKYQLLLLLYMSKGVKKVGDRDTFLKDAINALNSYFVFDSLKALNAFKENARHNLNANFFDELNKILKKYINHCDIDDPNIKIYALINKGFKITQIKKLQKMYFKLKRLTLDNWERLTSETQNEVYIPLVNFATTLKNHCCQNFKHELFSLRKFGIKQHIHLIYGQIDSATFYRVVTSACDVNAFDWCDKFMSENQTHLSNIERHDILRISKAYFNLSKKQYDDALMNLLQADSLNTTLNTPFKVVARIIELKCMYFINDYDRFENSHRRVNQFLNNQNELNETTIERLKLFIKITVKLFKVKNQQVSHQSKLLTELEDLINKAVRLYEKPWLLEQFSKYKI